MPLIHNPTYCTTHVHVLCGKSPGSDYIDTKTIKLLPKKAVLFITILFHSISRIQYFPTQWKRAKIIMIPKAGKPENSVSSCRPISLLPAFSKVFERILLRRLLPLLETNKIIPEHQFGFRNKHGTLEQCHRIIQTIIDTLKNKKYCSAVFLDVQQAFDRVWHRGLLYKIKKYFPMPYYLLFKSYLENRTFYVSVRDDRSDLYDINAGIPQGSVLGPVLYTIFTADMPTCNDVVIATYADDTALLASDSNNVIASTYEKTYQKENLLHTL